MFILFQHMKLDRSDLRILDELQRDGSLTNAELARRIGLSPSPCLARVKALEAAGVIQRYVALASAAALGLGLTVFISISLKTQNLGRVRKCDRTPRRGHGVLSDDWGQRLPAAGCRDRYGGAGAIHPGAAFTDPGCGENPFQLCAQTGPIQDGLAPGSPALSA